MQNLTFIRFLVLFSFGLLLGLNGWGQTSISVNGETLAKHGFNSSGENKNPGSEQIDSVTTGSTSKYYVVPDATLNPSYSGILTGTLTTNFTWSANNKAGADISSQSSVTGFETYSNYRQLVWSGKGTLDLTVQEFGSGCGGTPRVIPVEVISVPTISFTNNNEADGICLSATDGSLNYKLAKTFQMIYNSEIGGSKQDIKVRINIKGLNRATSADLEIDVIRVSSTKGTFSLPSTFEFDLYDVYEITLVSVSDRISRKNNVWNSTSGKYTCNIYPIPETGAVQHISNM